MADEADVAADLQQTEIDSALKHHRRQKEKFDSIVNNCTGQCLNCEEPLDTGRFCDGDCKDDYEKRVNAVALGRYLRR